MRSNQALLADALANRPTIDASQRNRIRGIILLTAYMAMFLIGGVIVYRITRLASLVAQSEPLPADTVANVFAETLRSNRFALAHGSKDQRLQIMGWLGDQGFRAAPLIDDLRTAATDPDPQIAAAAVVALRQIETSYTEMVLRRMSQEINRRAPQR